MATAIIGAVRASIDAHTDFHAPSGPSRLSRSMRMPQRSVVYRGVYDLVTLAERGIERGVERVRGGKTTRERDDSRPRKFFSSELVYEADGVVIVSPAPSSPASSTSSVSSPSYLAAGAVPPRSSSLRANVVSPAGVAVSPLDDELDPPPPYPGPPVRSRPPSSSRRRRRRPRASDLEEVTELTEEENC